MSVPANPASYPFPSQAFMVVEDDRQHVLEGLERLENTRADGHVTPHDGHLLIGEPSFLVDDGDGYADLTDVVEESAAIQPLQLSLV